MRVAQTSSNTATHGAMSVVPPLLTQEEIAARAYRHYLDWLRAEHEIECETDGQAMAEVP